MGKPSKWIKNLLTGKKSSSHQPISVDAQQNPETPISDSLASSKDKRWWSFRKAFNTETYQHELKIVDTTSNMEATLEAENEQKRHALTVAVATAAAADAAVQAAKAVATLVRETAAIKIQSVLRSYLARKALLALKGLVKLQALVRGHLVRKQATATFPCLQALLTAQAQARAPRIKMIQEPNPYNPKDDHVKIVEVDIGGTTGSAKSMISYFNNKRTDNSYSTYHHRYSKQNRQHISPAPSAITNMNSKSNSGHFNDFFYNTPHRSPQYNSSMDKPHPSKAHFSYKPESDRCYEYQFSPNYMANTKSSGKQRMSDEIAYLPPVENILKKNTGFQFFKSREDAYEELWGALLSQKSSSILGIYGIAGVGKTRMVEQIEEEAIEKRVFDTVARADVGSGKLDVIQLQDQIAEYFDCHFESQDDVDHRALQLKYSIMNRGKILIILDDVWSVIPLDVIGIPFGNDPSSVSCKILLTSQEEDVCLQNNCKRPVQITPLTIDEGWDLFREIVGTYQIDSLQDESIAKEVCNQCEGLPLLIHVVGKALESTSHIDWEDTLYQLKNCKVESISETGSEELDACLKLCTINSP